MPLSVYFRSYYVWLDKRAQELTQTLNAERLRQLIEQVSLVLACEHEILRPGLLTALLGSVPAPLRDRLGEDQRRAHLEQQLTRLARASSAAIFQEEMALVRDALCLAALHAESWALFAEAVLSPEEVSRLETLIVRCQDRCTVFPAAEYAIRVDVLH